MRRIIVMAVIIAGCVGNVCAQGELRFTNAGLQWYGAQLSLVFPEPQGADVAYGGGAQVDYELLNIVHAVPSLECWTSWHTYRNTTPGISNEKYSNSVTEFALSLDLRCYFPIAVPTPVKPFAGAGFGMMLVNHHYGDPIYLATSPANQNDFKVGIDFICGVDVPYKQYVPFVQFKGKSGGISTAKITVGINFPIKSPVENQKS